MVNGSIVSATFNQLASNVTYYWRCRVIADDLSDSSGWSTIETFSLSSNHPPSKPVHVSPANGDTVMSTPIILLIENSFDPEGDPILYDFWIYSDSSLNQVVEWIYSDSSLNQVVETRYNVAETLGQTAAQFSFQPVNGHKYWWRVRAKDSHTMTSPTQPTWFIYAYLPSGRDDYTAVPVSPENGVVVLTDRPVLSVANIPATGHYYYFFEVALDSGFFTPIVSSPPVPENEGGQTKWRVTEKLESGQTYFWRVRANDYDYSAVSSFTIEFQIYASPNPVHFRQGEHVTFHLPDEAVDLFIQTVSGEMVLLEQGISGEWAWHGANASGQNVATGIYLWYIPGTTCRGKIVVKP